MRLILLLLVAVIALHRPSRADDAMVGFVVVTLPDEAGPPLELALWYPAQDATPRSSRVGSFVQEVAPGAPLRGRNLPLVVISHGHGGFFASHADTALVLARAGFVVAAPTHTGDNYRDTSRATDLAARTRHVALAVAFATEGWRPPGDMPAVDRQRIAAFGFSAGGFTVLAAAGGVPDLGRIGAHCEAHPAFYDCGVIGGQAPPPGSPPLVQVPRRLRALVVAAPALGFTFGPGSLDAVTMPVQLWQAGADEILPAPFYVEPVRAALPRQPAYHREDRAGHFDFLAPCNEALARAVPAICTSAPGFDRAAFHDRFNADVLRFLTEAMAP